MGIWTDRVERVEMLLKAGANSISKFPIMRKFGSKEAKEIEKQAKKAGREFEGTITRLPEVNWKKEIEKIKLEKEMKNSLSEL